MSSVRPVGSLNSQRSIRSLRTDLRIAWQLTRGSDRREGWRVTLTALGAALATGIALAAVTLASLRGTYQVPVGHELLDEPGTRAGVILALLLLLIPVLGFLGQCARIGAVHRDRRLAGLRLAGAAPWQVRRIAALETGLACLLGSVAATVVSVALLQRLWDRPTALAWTGVALVAVGVPVLGAAASALALRRVVASPLGWVRRLRPRTGRGPGLLFLGALLLTGAVALVTVTSISTGTTGRGYGKTPLMVFGLVVTVGAGAVWLAGAVAGGLGSRLARRARTAATLIAAERLRNDPWAAARTHAAVLLVTVVGTGFVGVRQVMLADLRAQHRAGRLGMDMSYYTTGLDLTAAAILVALAIVLSGLAVGTAEALATRRRGLAALTAAGVPRAVLGRALLLETALPLLPAVALAGTGGMAIGVWYAALATEHTTPAVPYVALLVPLAVYAACLLAAATSLPLLRRSLHPAELRYA
ncbi:FtsX-like permease family protein [Streptomyces cellulosae]|uniref:FtsX-like permease family protein n=1 Tax=Streptomyces cellulosae TaxID=1968 RepID=UPI001F3855FD|nr:FtsX-like permease family protein [Streptomyces cellulosae]